MTNIHRALRHSILLLALPFAAMSGHATAQAYPTKPVRWIVAFAPGGGADNLARVVQSAWSEALGQSVVIDNRGGGGGTIGTEMTARSAPDGYTLLLVATGHTVNASLMPKLPYDPVKSFTSISLVASQSNILTVHPSVPVKTVKELVALAKSKPGGLSYASGGNGSTPHLSGELLKLMTGANLTHIPYKGSGPAIVDLLAGQVQLMFVGPISIEQHVKAGKLRPIAIADKKRMPIFPDVPTMTEAGFPGIETGTWYGLLGPAGMPAPIVNKLYGTMVKVLAQPDVKSRLLAQGVDIVASKPAELEVFLKEEIAKWRKVVREAKVTVD